MIRDWFKKAYENYQSSVAKQLMGWIVLASFLMTLAISCVQLYFDFRNSIENLDRDIKEIEKTIVPSLTRSIWLMDHEQIQIGMKGLLLYDKIVFVKVEAEDGNVFKEGKSQTSKFLEKRFKLEFINQGQPWVLGTISVQVDMGGIYQGLGKEGAAILLNNLLLVGTIVFIVLWVTGRVVAQPLSVLANHAANIRFRDKQDDINPKYLNQKHEIGQVFRAVEKLEQNLTEDYRIRVKAEDALKESQKKLEELIASRTQQLDETTKDLVESSRKAGMAEVATGVLHNIGNVLTGININVQNLEAKFGESASHRLPEFVNLFRHEGEHLSQLLTNPDKRESIIRYIEAIIEEIEGQRKEDAELAKTLGQNIKHIMQLVSQQQANAKHTGIINDFSITESIQDVLNLKSHDIQKNGIRVDFDRSQNYNITSDKHKVLQILTNLISNAIQSFEKREGDKCIEIVQRQVGSIILIDIRDNGVGIPSQNLHKLFRFGFTTKQNGNGFGLHSSAIDATTLGGKLSVHSDGLNHGATFKLKIPMKYDKSKLDQRLAG